MSERYTFHYDGTAMSVYSHNWLDRAEMIAEGRKMINEQGSRAELPGYVPILSFAEGDGGNTAIALYESNRATIRRALGEDSEEGVVWDERMTYGGTTFYVRPFESVCDVEDDGEHAFQYMHGIEHGYEDVEGFEDSVVIYCPCGAEYVDEGLPQHELSDEFITACDILQALLDYPILDEDDFHDREWELVEEEMDGEIEYWKDDQGDLTDDQADAVVDVFRNLDYLPEGIDPDGWDHIMVTEYVIPDAQSVDVDALVKVLDHCKESWYMNRAREQMTAQIEGQMGLI